MGSVCAIHQPNFFPWLGYFDKIRQADVFVFLDEVAFPKCGSGSWINRVRINIQGAPAWFGCPVRRASGIQKIRTIRIDDAQPWRTRLLRTLEANYRRAPGFTRTMDLVHPLMTRDTDNLADFNIAAIRVIAAAMGLECRFVRQSELMVDGAATDLLIGLTKAVGATAYLAGGGAAGYQQDGLFAPAGLELRYQDFQPRPYGDPSRFLPGLSVIDWLMRAGSEVDG